MTFDFLPAGGLASSVITTVWVGIMVVVFFNLRFGTTLSGLVVPGYLIPLFLVRPVSAWVILAESILTYLIARLLSDRGLVKLGLGEFFGRDRFFMLILISILVRIVSDGFALPLLSEQLAAWGAPYELRTGLHSFGLIIIALCANQFWNGGLKIGSLTLAVYLISTFAIIKFILIPLTNFNISTLSYMYEDIASSVLASPKAYIILITAAFVASRMNLRYGWDFNGILIPSLLALQWYNPLKILTTFAEAFVIYLGAVFIMGLPYIRQINMEGARLLLLFFNVGFLYKLILGYIIIWFIPTQKVTDFYGFGYLLGTLIALKMYEKGIAIRFTRTTLQTSFTAIVLASLIGFGLTFFSLPLTSNTVDQQGNVLLQHSDASLSEVVAELRSLSYQSEGVQQPISLTGIEGAEFSQLFKQLTLVLHSQEIPALAGAAQSLGYMITLVQERYLVVHDITPQRGWFFFVVDLQAKGQLAVEVPRALDEPQVAAVADSVFTALGARYLAYAGSRSSRADDGSDDVLLNSQTLLQLFHRATGANNTLQLRGYTRLSARQLLGVRQDQQKLDLTVQQTSMWVKRSLPADLVLQQLKLLLGDFTLNWHAPAAQNRQRDTSISGFAEVYINDRSVLNIYSQTAIKQQYTQVAQQQRIDGYLQSFLQEGKFSIATKHSQAYVPANKYQMLYFDQAVLQPTLTLIDQIGKGQWQTKHQSSLNKISVAAKQFGYQTLLYRHLATGSEYIIFKEETFKNSGELLRHWGTYVLKVGGSSDYIVEVPMPLFEQNTFEFGSMLFEALDARAILIAGTHPQANSDGSSLLTSSQTPDSLFNLFHQGLLRHDQHRAPFALQIRGFSPASSSSNEIIVAHFEYQKPAAQRHPALLSLKKTLQNQGLPVLAVNSEEQRFVAKLNAQSRYTKYIETAQYAEVWIPAKLREKFDRGSEDDLLSKKIAALGWPVMQTDVKQWLQEQNYTALSPSQLIVLRRQFDQFFRSENIAQLAILAQTVPLGTVMLLIDHNSRQRYLTVTDEQHQVVLVVNLAPLNITDTNSIEVFIDQRQRYLIGESHR